MGPIVAALASLVGCSSSVGGGPRDAGPQPDRAVATDPCDRIKCAPGQECVEGVCVRADPCATITCRDEGTVCSFGSCVNWALDEDHDGSPAAADCDDHDPEVVAGSTQSCETACGEGTSTCARGVWANCSAPVDCSCAPGDVRAETCGRCGQAQRVCTDEGTWGALGECLGQGACEAGALSVEPCPGGSECSHRERTCDDRCGWGDWETCRDDAECEPGDTDGESCGACGTAERTCGEGCLWGAYGECTGEGECASGDVEERSCGSCSIEERTCDDACAWGPWASCQEGCSPGDRETQGCGACGTSERVCEDGCTWSSWGACMDQGECAAGQSETEPCGLCGSRTRTCDGATCSWGTWSACGGEGVCSVGAQEGQPCGNCGTESRTCLADCTWGGWGACGGSGPCVAGATETQACGNCGTQGRTCNAGCQWDPWGVCAEGACAPGAVDTQPCGNCGTHTRTCLPDCSWDAFAACVGDGNPPVATATCTTVASGTCNGAWQTLDAASSWYGFPGCTCVDQRCQSSTTADLGSIQRVRSVRTWPMQCEELWVETSTDGTSFTQQYYGADADVGDQAWGLDAAIGGDILAFPEVDARWVRVTVANNWCAFAGVDGTEVNACP